MPDTGTYSTALVNTLASTLATQCNSGYLRIYSGIQPAGPDTAVSAAPDHVLLAELRFGATAFGAPTNGLITANAITADSSANASGDAAWCRALKSDGTTALFDGSAGMADDAPNLALNTTAIVAGEPVSVSALSILVPAGL
jgi:hypothetical protein